MKETCFLATREVVALLANYPIMSGSSICLFRHLEPQNLFQISEFMGKTIGFPKINIELQQGIFH